MIPETAQLAAGASPLAIPDLAVGLLGGLGLFLFGLELMTGALKAVAGDRLRSVLANLTRNRVTGALSGAAVTAVIQSSSVTTVVMVGFVSSGLMTLTQAVGVILGANIGTTVTAQIVAFKVTKLALVLVAAGYAAAMTSGRETIRQHGTGMLGLGLVFLGMTLMGDAMAPLRGHPPILEWMVRLEQPLLGMLAGAAFTALVQSSSATTGVVIAMASEGLLTLPAGIALVLGANVGTCVTAMLAAIGKPREAVRAATVHVLFNLIGVLLWAAFIPELASLAAQISPKAPGLPAAEQLAALVPRQVANAHTLFNTLNALLFLPFTGLLAAAAIRLVPDRPQAAARGARARYLDRQLLSTPSLAMHQVRLELQRLGKRVCDMLDAVLPVMISGSPAALHDVAEMDEDIDGLYAQTIDYLGRISRKSLSPAESRELATLLDAANSLESVGDLIETDLVSRGRGRADAAVRVSPETRKVLEDFHASVAAALRDAVESLGTSDPEGARRVVARKPQIQQMAGKVAQHQAERLVADEGQRLETYSLEMDMLEDLRRIYYFAKRLAKGTLERAGEDG